MRPKALSVDWMPENVSTGRSGATDGVFDAGSEAPRIRLLRGRALVRLDPAEIGEHRTDGGVWVPGSAVRPRDQKVHRGTVLALGPPARQGGESGPEIEWGVDVGDRVVFAYAVWLQKMRQWEDIAVVAHSEILAVVDP